MAEKIDVYQIVTDKIVEALEQGYVPWQRPWTAGGPPRSMSSGKCYRGVNVLLLGWSALSGDFNSAWWGTYRQIEALGGQVRKGEHGTIITLWKTFDKKPEAGAPADAKPQKGFMLRYFKVFNACQADGLPEKFYAKTQDHDEVASAETVVRDYFNAPGAPGLDHSVHGQAHYIPSLDHVQVPPLNEHVSPDEYYATMFHEMTHSTGAEHRCNRYEVQDYKGHNRGVEELTAEIGACILMAECDIKGAFDNAASYIGGWIKTIKEDNKIIVKAASKAAAAVDFIHAVSDEDEPESE
jgi:antirestriction protein ArdC